MSNDWIFDFVFQFLESEQFDSAIMDFVDNNCHHFSEDEENRLIYTSIHNDFTKVVEKLLTDNMGELGISNEKFFEICDQGRSQRDINSNVFERLIAIDDFAVFKVGDNIECVYWGFLCLFYFTVYPF